MSGRQSRTIREPEATEEAVEGVEIVSLDQNAFVENVRNAFDVPDADIGLDTEFQSLDEWDSLASVSTVAMVLSEYDVQITGDELVACRTVGDILSLVESRRADAA